MTRFGAVAICGAIIETKKNLRSNADPFGKLSVSRSIPHLGTRFGSLDFRCGPYRTKGKP
jgi:hypothetical protein